MHPKRKAVRSAAKDNDANDAVIVDDDARRVQRHRRFKWNPIDRKLATNPGSKVDDGDSGFFRCRRSTDDDQLVAFDDVRRVAEPWNEAGDIKRRQSVSPASFMMQVRIPLHFNRELSP